MLSRILSPELYDATLAIIHHRMVFEMEDGCGPAIVLDYLDCSLIDEVLSCAPFAKLRSVTFTFHPSHYVLALRNLYQMRMLDGVGISHSGPACQG